MLWINWGAKRGHSHSCNINWLLQSLLNSGWG